MRYTFSPEQRIKSKREITALLKEGIRFRSDLFFLCYRENETTYDRSAVIVSKKSGPAVVRNRLKRVFREVFRTVTQPQRPFFDILFLPRCASSEPMNRIRESYAQWRKKQKA